MTQYILYCTPQGAYGSRFVEATLRRTIGSTLGFFTLQEIPTGNDIHGNQMMKSYDDGGAFRFLYDGPKLDAGAIRRLSYGGSDVANGFTTVPTLD